MNDRRDIHGHLSQSGQRRLPGAGGRRIYFEELPGGAGYADILYLPKKYSEWPALLVELKWDRSAGTALSQVKARNYPEALKGYGGPLVLVGVSYDKEARPGERRHECVIETVEV